MRLIRLLPFVAVLIAAPASAQEWTDFTSKIDRFTVNLPSEPKSQDLKWESEYGAVFPGRGASVIQLQRRGWSKEKLKAGDKISVRCHQLRDGSDGCLLGFITTADGTETIFD